MLGLRLSVTLSDPVVASGDLVLVAFTLHDLYSNKLMRRPVVSFSALDEDDDRQHARRPRIHPSLFLAGLLGSLICGGFLLSELAGYAPPEVHTPSNHDELLSRSMHRPRHLDYGRPGLFRPRTWNSIASVLGGFSMTSVYSPELNVSWTARPAGFGPRILGKEAFEGQLLSIAQFSQDADPSTAVKGCHVDLDKALNRHPGRSSSIALIERGECPFISKIVNAQALHFDAVIIYNDRGTFGQVDDDELLSMWSPSREARLLSIPSVFVGRAAGKTLETLANSAAERNESFIVDIQPEEPPHLFLLDIVIMLFFLPTLFTTVVLVITRVRQIRYRRAQRAPQELVDSLPSFVWREGLEHEIDATEVGEKDVSVATGDAQQGKGKRARRPSVYLSDLLARAIRRPGETESPSVPAGKAKHLARKIFSQTECAICLGDFVTGETVKLLPCGHIYHVAEIDSWLTEQKRWCPVCRCPIDGETDEEAVESANGGTVAIPSTALAGAQPIISPSDIDVEDERPIASSSTAHERTPLLSRLSSTL